MEPSFYDMLNCDFLIETFPWGEIPSKHDKLCNSKNDRVDMGSNGRALVYHQPYDHSAKISMKSWYERGQEGTRHYSTLEEMLDKEEVEKEKEEARERRQVATQIVKEMKRNQNPTKREVDALLIVQQMDGNKRSFTEEEKEAIAVLCEMDRIFSPGEKVMRWKVEQVQNYELRDEKYYGNAKVNFPIFGELTYEDKKELLLSSCGEKVDMVKFCYGIDLRFFVRVESVFSHETIEALNSDRYKVKLIGDVVFKRHAFVWELVSKSHRVSDEVSYVLKRLGLEYGDSRKAKYWPMYKGEAISWIIFPKKANVWDILDAYGYEVF